MAETFLYVIPSENENILTDNKMIQGCLSHIPVENTNAEQS